MIHSLSITQVRDQTGTNVSIFTNIRTYAVTESLRDIRAHSYAPLQDALFCVSPEHPTLPLSIAVVIEVENAPLDGNPNSSRTVGHIEFGENMDEVGLDRGSTDEEDRAYLFVGMPL